MAHIEVNKFPRVPANDLYSPTSFNAINIFTANLQIDPTIKDTIIRTIQDGGDRQNQRTNVKATIMTDYFMQEEPGFVELEKEITSIVNYIPNILFEENPRNFNVDMHMGNMWGMCYKKNDYTRVHDHWPAVWSGTFYLDIPTDYAGTLFFPELEHNIEPVTGQLILFTGTTLHGVKTIKSNSDRLAISFNYYLSPDIMPSPKQYEKFPQ